MDQPLTVWYCDTCGGKIESIENAYVIWRSDGTPREFKIIHKSVCDKKDHDSSAALEDFLGPRGLSYCLTLLHAGPIIANLGGSASQPQPDPGEFVDFVRRVQVPFYEQARLSFNNPELLSDMSDWNEVAPYLPDALKNITLRYASER